MVQAPGWAALTVAAISESLGLIESQRFLLRMTTANLRFFRSC